MNPKDKEQRRDELLRCICTLPKNMVTVHGIDNVTEFLIHHLAASNCFNFSKAAYFVNNVDFKTLKGVAGYHKPEAYDRDNHWDNKDHFSDHMKQAPFNCQVRNVEQESLSKEPDSVSGLATNLAQELGINSPSHHSWAMKYDNHGLFVFELADQDEQELVQDHLEETLYLFGFCPVF